MYTCTEDGIRNSHRSKFGTERLVKDFKEAWIAPETVEGDLEGRKEDE
jgi:hypothetical protein